MTRHSIGNLVRDRRGAAAASFVLMLPLLLGGVAMATDYANFRIVHTRMQAAADAAALAAIDDLDMTSDAKVDKALDIVGRNIPEDYGDVTRDSDVTLGWYTSEAGFVESIGSAPVNAARVVSVRSVERGNAVNRIFSAFISNDDLTIRTVALAARPTNVSYEPPELTLLDNEAGDFNELYVYCYDQAGTGSAESRRSDMTLIANNMPEGQNIVSISNNVIKFNPPAPEDLEWPRCDQKNMTLSFRMRNVRHAKSNPVLWKTPGAKISDMYPGRPEHNHYTDTTISNGLESFGGLIQPITDNVRCDTLDACNTKKSGNIVFPPGFNRKNRNPRSAPEGCAPGKFMYFGWEDRPPNQPGTKANWLHPAWTDKDFDDIAVVMRCPRNGPLGTGKPRLVG